MCIHRNGGADVRRTAGVDRNLGADQGEEDQSREGRGHVSRVAEETPRTGKSAVVPRKQVTTAVIEDQVCRIIIIF